MVVENRRHPLILALNKIDLVRKPQLLGLSAKLCERLNPDKVFMISAAQGEGVADLKQALAEAMPEVRGSTRRTRSPTRPIG